MVRPFQVQLTRSLGVVSLYGKDDRGAYGGEIDPLPWD